MTAGSIAVVVPVRDGRQTLGRCLDALRRWTPAGAEIVVVDDGSHDDGAAVAERAGARVVRLTESVGAGEARNRGVRATTAPIVVFIDADVCVGPETVRGLAAALEPPGGVSAVFGAYDARPAAPGIVSQFRNLLHRHVHCENAGDARTFWTGCGAVRREAFESVGGFAPGRRSMEDVDLGYRLHDAGHRILLDPRIEATHLKRWTLWSMLRADLFGRAIPWALLMLERAEPHDHLNVRPEQRASVVVSLLMGLALLAAPWRPALLGAVVAGAVVVAVLNRRFLAVLRRERGPAFAVAAVPLLVVHYLTGGVGYAWARAIWMLRGRRAATGASRRAARGRTARDR